MLVSHESTNVVVLSLWAAFELNPFVEIVIVGVARSVATRMRNNRSLVDPVPNESLLRDLGGVNFA